jgi:hypothetical protein
MKFVAVGVVCIAVLAAHIKAWGNDGHALTASVAQKFLSSGAQNLVQKLIGADMSTVASWADQVKFTPEYEWSGMLHYIDTPDWECGFTYSTDCIKDQCVAGAIANYTTRLLSSDTNGQIEALKFLIHFAGDIHQPLHVAFASDEGGNTEKGTFMEYSDKVLHAIWDSYIIYERMDNDFSRSESLFLNHLLNRTTGDLASKVASWNSYTKGAENTWAAETAKIACQYAYTDQSGNHITDGFNLQNGYYQFVLDIVEQQLIKGGVRLAAMLNKLASKPQYADLLNNVSIQ